MVLYYILFFVYILNINCSIRVCTSNTTKIYSSGRTDIINFLNQCKIIDIEEVVIEDNRLVEFNPNKIIKSLKKLVICNSCLRKFPDLSEYPLLEHVSFNNNQLTNINLESFPPNLKYLDVSMNLIEYFKPQNTFNTLTYFNISGNPYNCLELSQLHNLNTLIVENHYPNVSHFKKLTTYKANAIIGISNNSILDSSVVILDIKSFKEEHVDSHKDFSTGPKKSIAHKNEETIPYFQLQGLLYYSNVHIHKAAFTGFYKSVSSLSLSFIHYKDLFMLYNFKNITSLKIDTILLSYTERKIIESLIDSKFAITHIDKSVASLPKLDFEYFTNLKTLEIGGGQENYLFLSKKQIHIPHKLEKLTIKNAILVVDNIFSKTRHLKHVEIKNTKLICILKNEITTKKVKISIKYSDIIKFEQHIKYSGLSKAIKKDNTYTAFTISKELFSTKIRFTKKDVTAIKLLKVDSINLKDYINLRKVLLYHTTYTSETDLDLENIKTLELYGMNSIKMLRSKSKLEELYIHTYSKSKIGEYIFEEKDNIKELEAFIKHQKTLHSLTFISSCLKDIKFVEELTYLKELNFYDNQISDISEIKFPKSLKSLILEKNPLEKIGRSLSGLHELEYLNISSRTGEKIEDCYYFFLFKHNILPVYLKTLVISDRDLEKMEHYFKGLDFLAIDIV